MGQSTYGPQWANGASPESKTIGIILEHRTVSGDHTILAHGDNNLSLAADGTGIQLEVNGSLATWVGALPFVGMKILFIDIDKTTNFTTLYEYDYATDSLLIRAQSAQTPNVAADYTRIGQGNASDSNHQDYEYMHDGSVREYFVFNGKAPNYPPVPDPTKKEIGKLLWEGGFLVTP